MVNMPNRPKSFWESVQSGTSRHFFDKNVTQLFAGVMLVLAGLKLPDYVQQSTPEHVSFAVSGISNDMREGVKNIVEVQDSTAENMVLADGK